MIKEKIKTVEKVWGEEIWLVNNESYCGKLLVFDEGATSSYHYHPKKKETFYCLEGYGDLKINGKTELLAPFTRPKTIEPSDRHSVYARTPLVLIEISTTHDDNDVIRLSESKRGDVSDGMERPV